MLNQYPDQWLDQKNLFTFNFNNNEKKKKVCVLNDDAGNSTGLDVRLAKFCPRC